jgi:hypothetical protein
VYLPVDAASRLKEPGLGVPGKPGCYGKPVSGDWLEDEFLGIANEGIL